MLLLLANGKDFPIQGTLTVKILNELEYLGYQLIENDCHRDSNGEMYYLFLDAKPPEGCSGWHSFSIFGGNTYEDGLFHEAHFVWLSGEYQHDNSLTLERIVERINIDGFLQAELDDRVVLSCDAVEGPEFDSQIKIRYFIHQFLWKLNAAAQQILPLAPIKESDYIPKFLRTK